MNRFAMFCTGLLLMCSLTGCCCLSGGGCGPCGGGYGAAYPYSGGCPGGACGASAPGYPTAFNTGTTQAAYSPGTTTALVEPLPMF